MCLRLCHTGEVGFLPGLVFPFVKLHMSVGTPASSPACFETVATVLLYWTRGEASHGWFCVGVSVHAHSY